MRVVRQRAGPGVEDGHDPDEATYALRSRSPLPPRTHTTMRRLSMSAAFSRLASDTRKPHEYIMKS